MNNTPQYIMDLMIGYSKQNSKSLIPTCLNRLFGIYFFIFKQKDLFRIKFKYPETYGYRRCDGNIVVHHETDYFFAVSSICSNIAFSNECNKLLFKIGNIFCIEINILQSEININAQGKVNHIVTKIDGKKWKMNKNLTKYIDIMIRMNRKTICQCQNTDGSIELFFFNTQEIPQIALSQNIWNWNVMFDWENNDLKKSLSHQRAFGKIEITQSHGHCKISLNEEFDFDSNEQASIEVHGSDKMYVWSSKQADHKIEAYGFGRYCCRDACNQFCRKLELEELKGEIRGACRFVPALETQWEFEEVTDDDDD